MSDTSNSFENLRILARRAWHDQCDFNTAADYYKKILFENPNDWEAFFYDSTYKIAEELMESNDGFADSFQSVEMDFENRKYAFCRFEKVISTALKLLKEKNPNSSCESELYEMYGEVDRLFPLTTTGMISLIHVLGEEDPSAIPIVADIFIDAAFEDMAQTLFNIAEQGLEIVKSDKAAAKIYGIIDAFISTMKDMPFYHDMNGNSKQVFIKTDMKLRKRIKPLVERRIDEYWEQHAEEKQQLLTEKAELLEKTNKLKKGIDELKDEEYEQDKKNIEKMKDHLSTLESRYSKLGIFKKKEKEELQQLISKTKTQLKQTEETIAEKDEVIDPLHKEYVEGRNRIIRIETRFSKVEEQVMDEFLSRNED